MEKNFPEKNNPNYLNIETKRTNTESTKLDKISNISEKK